MGFCGYRCESCPAFRATHANDAEGLARCAAAWGRMFGVEIHPEQLRCDGCYNELGRKSDQNCLVRPCCQSRGCITCAECGEYPCAKLVKRFVERREIEDKLGMPVDEETYQTYIRPLENKARLDLIHKRYRK